MPIRSSYRSPARRRGFVILAVLLVIVLLSLAAYQYSDAMVAEARMADRIRKNAEAHALADSGVQYCAAVLSSPDALAGILSNNPYDNPSVFQGRTVQEAPAGRRQGHFSIVSVDYSQDPASGSYPTRFGVVDEAGRINLNALVLLDPSGKIAHDVLMKLPNMTEDVANSIIDWIDADEDPRAGGAETQYYSALTPSYRCKNGPLDSLEELLLVKGVTRALLFGSDSNRTGNVSSGDAAADAGWAPYLTVYSHERNVDSQGNVRINLNSRDLATLYSQLQGAVGADLAAFIVAYRIFDVTTPGGSQGGSRGGAGGSQPSVSMSSSSSGGMSGTFALSLQAQSSAPAGGVPGTIQELATRVQSASTNFFTQPRRSIPSAFALINAQVSVPGQNGQPTKLYTSPLADKSKVRDLLPALLDETTTVGQSDLPGRININTASDTVLRCLPGLSDQDIQMVIDRRPPTNTLDAPDAIYQTPAWLYTEAGLQPQTIQTLERYITTRSQVYRVQSIGYFDNGGPMVRLEAVIDTNLGKPRILYYRDLTQLGRAFESMLQQ
jgi:DNA uptake protein ComE-like DNA-binding protein